eukprot:5146180-Pyramimonas_sp.AAC.1
MVSGSSSRMLFQSLLRSLTFLEFQPVERSQLTNLPTAPPSLLHPRAYPGRGKDFEKARAPLDLPGGLPTRLLVTRASGGRHGL